MGPFERRMRDKLATLNPTHLTLESESHKHGRPPDAETHFLLVIVSEAFAGGSRLERHRRVNDLLAAELSEHVHALGVRAYTPAEWSARAEHTFGSPACGGARKS